MWVSAFWQASCTAAHVGEADLAALERVDQLFQQDRHDLQADRHEREAEHAAHAAAFQLQVDQQERPLGEPADARVEDAPHRRHARGGCGCR